MHQRRRLWIPALLALATGSNAPLLAQTPSNQAAQSQNPSQAVVLNAYVVTGSNIPTAADATDVPVTVVGQQNIAQTGENDNLLDILRMEIPAFAGRSDIGKSNATNANQNTAGGSQIQLRNLDTLVLINGRRVANSGANADNGGKNFVDVSQIPTAAIERIEVLTDGASAIYGSDAVGGVINIILKSDYQGAEIGGRYAFSTNKGFYTERSGYLVAGASKDGVSVTITGSWSKTDPLWQNQRPFIAANLQSKPTFPGVAGGHFLDPTLPSPSLGNPTGTSATATSYAALIANGTYESSVPLVNLSPYQTILLQSDQRGAVGTFTADIVPKKLVAFGDAELSSVRSFAQTNVFLNNLASVTVPAGAPFNPLTIAATGVIAGNLDTPLQTFNHATGARGTFGFRGEINPDWNWEVAGTYSKEDLTQDLKNELFSPNLAAAIAGGYNSAGVATPGGNYSKVIEINGYPGTTNYVYQPALDPFARGGLIAASLANVYGTEVIGATSELKGLDAKLVGAPFSLPAGKAYVAVGVATRTESLAGNPDENSRNLSTSPANHNWGAGGVFFDPFDKSRTIDSYYAEARLPLTGSSWSVPGLRTLELSLAGRTEKYSDTGTSSVPKVGLRWQPLDDQFTVRFTYSKAFTAPDLWHEYGPPSVTAASGTAVFAPSNLGVTDANLLKPLSYFSGNGNNPLLQPSHAWSRSAGFVYSPKAVKGFTVSVDYADVFQKGLPAGIGATNIVNSVNALGSASPYFSAIAVGAIPGTPGASQTAFASPNGIYNYLVANNYNASSIYIADHFVNSGGVHVEAYDITPEYVIPTRTMGTFTIGTTGTYLQHFLFSALPGQPFYEFAGYSTNTQTEAGSFPHYSFYTSLDWKYHNWEATVGDTYMSSMIDIGPAPAGKTYAPANYLAANPAIPVSYYTEWDLQLAYTIDAALVHRLSGWLNGARLAVGVNDLFNRMPPYAGLSQSNKNNYNNVDTAEYSPIGRLFYVTASRKF